MLGMHEQEAFGRFLVDKKEVLSSESFEACLKVQGAMRELGIEKSLDKVICEKGLLEEKLITELVREFRGGDEEFIRGYRIISKLGEGAMGEVFKAIDLVNDNREVAIKILFPHLGKRKATAQRFLQEAQICIEKLDHPNIVKGYEVGYEASKDCYFYVMEHIGGINLGKAIEERGVFQEEAACKVMLQISSALGQATKFNLVHRDVKPDNILITENDNAKLCDLGLARDWARDLSLTRTGAVMGTPFYISPEVATGMDEFDCRSDIYSLGATIYHAVVGKVPFGGNNTMIVLYRHRSEPLIPPIELRPQISPGFSAIIETMMAKSPEDRYQTPAELIADINRLNAKETPEALKKKEKRFNKNDVPFAAIDDPGKSTELLHINHEPVDFEPMRRQDGVDEIDPSQESRVDNGGLPEVELDLPSRNVFQDLSDKFLNSAERRVVEEHSRWKLMAFGAVIMFFGMMSLFLAYLLIDRLMG